MFTTLFRKFFKSSNERYITKLKPLVAKINDTEKQYQGLSDDQLKAKTDAADYQKLCAQRQKEAREKRQEKLSQRKSQRSSQADA